MMSRGLHLPLITTLKTASLGCRSGNAMPDAAIPMMPCNNGNPRGKLFRPLGSVPLVRRCGPVGAGEGSHHGVAVLGTKVAFPYETKQKRSRRLSSRVHHHDLDTRSCYGHADVAEQGV